MRPNAVPMSEESYARVPDLLREHGINVEPFRRIDEFTMLRCWRDDAAVLLSVAKPPHWAAAVDERRDKLIVAAVGESVLRFWRIPRENQMRRQIIEYLRSLEWRP